MRNRWLYSTVILMSILLASCGTEPQGGGQQPSYKDMKSMVIDILKTEDAQKALQESAIQSAGPGGGQMGMLSIQDKEQVRMAVKDVLVSPEYDKVIEKLMTNERFAGDFAKAVNKQNKQIHKDLMKDPSYQEALIKVMKNPEMDKMILDVLKSTQYRKEVVTIMQETMQSPLIRVQILDLLKKAVKEELKIKPDEKVKKKGEEEGGGEGGGEGGEEGEGGEGGEGGGED